MSTFSGRRQARLEFTTWPAELKALLLGTNVAGMQKSSKSIYKQSLIKWETLFHIFPTKEMAPGQNWCQYRGIYLRLLQRQILDFSLFSHQFFMHNDRN